MKNRLLFMSIFLSMIVFFASVGGVYASWNYIVQIREETNETYSIEIGDFHYNPDMPSGEVLFLQRMDDILNQKYTTETIKDARKYLLEETIQVRWEEYAPP